MDSNFFFFLLNSSHAEILKVPTWFYSFASGTYCHWSWSRLCCLILGFTEYREKGWAKAGSSMATVSDPGAGSLLFAHLPVLGLQKARSSSPGLLPLQFAWCFTPRQVGHHFYLNAAWAGSCRGACQVYVRVRYSLVCCGAVPLVFGENCGSFRSKHIAASTPNKWYRLKFHSEGMVVIEAIHGTTKALPPSKLNIWMTFKRCQNV